MTFFTAIVTSALVSIGMTAAVAGVVAPLVIGVAFLGVSSLLNSMKPTAPTPQAQATVNQSVGPRIRGYGRALLSGTRAFWDSKDGDLYQAVMMHSGEIDYVEQVRVGDIVAILDADGVALNDEFSTHVPASRGKPGYTVRHVQIKWHPGSAGQGADGMLTAAFHGLWTGQHRLDGIAYFVSKFNSPSTEEFQRVFPESYNTPVKAVCRLTRVWDPRNGNFVWSDNASLCILDYLTHKDGYRASRDDIDLNSFALFANVCGEGVQKADGSWEARYRLSGIYSLSEDPQDVLARMRVACDAELYQTAEGKIAIRGGKWLVPTVTVADTNILGHSFEQGNNRFSAFNELKILYTSPDHDFQTMEAVSWIDYADQDERGVLQTDLALDMVPSPSQARRLAKIHVAKANPRWKGSITADMSALDALGERTIRLILPELEIDDAFFVTGFAIKPDLTGVDISVVSISEAAYTWSTAEEAQAAPLPQDTSPDLTFPVPQNFSLELVDGIIVGTVDAPDREGLELRAKIRAGAGSLWQDMAIDGLTAEFGPAPEAQYEAQAHWRGPQNVVGAWSFPLAETDTSQPLPIIAPPTNVLAELEDDDETVSVSWRMADSPVNLIAKVWRVAGGEAFDAAIEIHSAYAAPNLVYAIDDLPGLGAWNYYVTAETGGGNRSVASGPAEAAVML